MKKVTSIILLFVSINSMAQDGPQKIIDKFFDLYSSKNATAAVDFVFSTNKWMDGSKDQIENVKYKLNNTIRLIGNYHGHDLIVKKTVGEHLVLYTFIILYDRQPLRFTMLFYKPKDEWQLQNFSYDDALDTELEEAAKAYRLDENLRN